ncbi:MAG: hypothetical protein Ta2D_13630 [Rickettsiales bacterium]|nr:MAG: hypothetical protein Ta2D_13630 [Rickettsiales bacterium]
MNNESQSICIQRELEKAQKGVFKWCINCNHENCHKCLINKVEAIMANEIVMWEAM